MKQVLITGANRGVGLELTRQLLARGDRVIAACRQPDQAQTLQQWAIRFGDQLLIVALDVTGDPSVQAARAGTENAVDRLDTLLSIPGGLSVALLRIDPRWDPLRDHPRFRDLLEKYSSQQVD